MQMMLDQRVRQLRVAGAISTAVAAVALAALVVVGYAYLTVDELWNPLGEYPVQEVTEITDAAVFTHGIKCNDSDEPVNVAGSFGWQRLSPSGFAITLGEGRGVRIPGCEEFSFTNDIPDEVREADAPGTLWAVVGTETPIAADGTEGVPRRWATVAFELEG